MPRSFSPTSTRPVYLRLRDIIAAAILDGEFAEGEMLPSVRAFAADQGANPLTVAKAFQQFQDDGLIAVRRGVGMYVTQGAAARLRGAERATFLKHEWPEIRARLDRLDLSLTDLMSNRVKEFIEKT